MPIQRVKLANGQYRYVQVGEDNKPTEFDESTGKFKMYNSPNATGDFTWGWKNTDTNDMYGYTYDGPDIVVTGNPNRKVGIQREQDDHWAALDRDKKVDEQVNQSVGGWTTPESKLETKSEQTPQQRLGNYWRNSPFKGLDNIFANLMTLGYASTAEDGVKDINNGDYISGGLKILSPLAYGSGKAASLVGKAGDLYDLIGPDGVPKTFREFKNGNYKAGLTSLAGDLFNYFGPDKLNHEMENGNHFKSFIAGGKEGYDKINSFQPDNNIKITASVRDNSNNGNNNLL